MIRMRPWMGAWFSLLAGSNALADSSSAKEGPAEHVADVTIQTHILQPRERPRLRSRS